MSVLIVHTASGWPGSARLVAAAAAGLAQRGLEVVVAAPPDSSLAGHLSEAAVVVESLPRSSGSLIQAVRLRRLIRKHGVEVVIVQNERELLAAAAAVRLAGRGAVLRRIASDERPILAWRARLAARLAVTGILYPAPAAAARALPLPAALAPRIVEPGIDHAGHALVTPASRELLHIPEEARAIAAVCDGDARVRLPTLLRAIALLAGRHPELRLILVGPGSSDEQIRIHTAALGISSAVVQLGDRADQLAVLGACEVAWVAARGDAGALAFLDCMGLRRPVLAERDALSERYVADGISGVLLPPGDPPAAAAAIAALLGVHERRLAMGNAGQARVARDFSEEAMVDSWALAIESAREGANRQR
jgi:glycosyltransferase involved in cell wall biosynthesis